MSDLSPRSLGKRERDYRRSPPRTDRRSPPRYRDRSPPRKRRRDEFDRSRDSDYRRRESPDRRREDRGSRGGGRDPDDDSPRRRRSGGGRDSQRYDGPLQSFKQFSETLDDRVSYSTAQRRYEDYKQDYDKKNQRDLFNAHREEEWLRELYFPTALLEHDKIEATRAQQASLKFLQDLKSGLLDGVSWEADNFEEYLKEDAPVEIEEVRPADQNAPPVVPPKEDTANGDAQMTDIESAPTPNENEEHKKETEVKNEKKEEPKPSEQPQETRPKSELLKIPTGPHSLVIEGIPLSCTRAELTEALSKPEKPEIVLSGPNPTKNFVRFAYAGFSSAEACTEALEKLKNLVLREATFSVSRYEKPRLWRLTPRVASSSSRIHMDLETARKLVRAFDDHRAIEKNILMGRISTENETELIALEDRLFRLSEKEQLDLFITYLQRVHCHRYYTCDAYPGYDQSLVLRGTPKNCSNEDEHYWERELDRKNKEKIAFLETEKREINGELFLESMLEDLYNEKVVRESEERFRCDLCTKMFKGAIFVQKHIQNRHPEVINEIREKALDSQFYRNFGSDPSRITPSMMYEFPDDKADRKKSSPDRLGDRRRGPSPRDTERDNDKDRDSEALDKERNGEKYTKSRDQSPPTRDVKRSPRARERVSPRGRSPGRDRSPLRDKSSRERSRSPRSGRRNWSPSRRGRGRRGGRFSGGRPRRDDQMADLAPPPEFKERQDPRSYVSYQDLDKPPEDSVEIDYEKALAAFASGGQ